MNSGNEIRNDGATNLHEILFNLKIIYAYNLDIR
jgi:hypothetical protein